jgi:hypothetical protein
MTNLFISVLFEVLADHPSSVLRLEHIIFVSVVISGRTSSLWRLRSRRTQKLPCGRGGKDPWSG